MSKSTELRTTTDLVKIILERDSQARNSDNYLYLKVLQAIGRENGIDVDNMPVLRFFLHLKDFGCFPAFETVRRTRQKLQAEFSHLAANDRVEGKRTLNEEAFRDYARKVMV